MAETVALGPFELRAPIGRGGMGEVWAGRHREQGVPIAVKVLTRHAAHDPHFLSIFRNEVRVVAALTHPAVVAIYDHGLITDEAEATSGGRLRSGSPYYVMEYVDGGALGAACGQLSWPVIRAVLLRLLDALGHAHARGVIHRDLKPENVLCAVPLVNSAGSVGSAGPGEPLGSLHSVASGGVDQTSGIKLTDFGVAHAFEREGVGREADYVVGTPAFMAPEQVEGEWRDYGPWTDLYALGCVAYDLATGAPPFAGSNPMQVMTAHLLRALPPLRSRVCVPSGFEAWIRRLTRKSPGDRFRRAADAAWALEALPSVEMDTEPASVVALATLGETLRTPPPGAAFEDPSDGAVSEFVPRAGGLRIFWRGVTQVGAVPIRPQSADLHRRAVIDETLVCAPLSGRRRAGRGRTRWESQRIAGRGAPPVAESWCREDDAAPVPRLVGAGLGLYGLRPVPLVGRRAERDALWSALRQVHAERTPHLVLLDGPAGCGKSRLAGWLAERAHESGAATVLHATHGPMAGPGDGLAPMVARHLRCDGLTRPEILSRVETKLRADGAVDPEEWRAVAELVAASESVFVHGESTGESSEGAQVGRRGLADEVELARRFVKRLTAERPTIVWIDDVHWGGAARAFASRLIEEGQPGIAPILLVLTARDVGGCTDAGAGAGVDAGGAGAEGSYRAWRHALASHEAAGRARSLRVGPLSAAESPALVRQLLGLEPSLAARVESRTAGNPLFALQLVGDWVQRGLLEPSEAGFRMVDGESHDLPDDVDSVWIARVERAQNEGVLPDVRCLEAAAVLGQTVDVREWREVCALVGVDVDAGVVEVLLDRRLARFDEGGDPRVRWSFAHGQLRESLERRARQGGRWPAYHRTCARMLQRKGGPQLAERMGRHLCAAGDGEAALGPMLDGARERFRMGDYAAAEALVTEREQELERLEMPAADPRCGEGWLASSQIAMARGELDGATSWAARAESSAARFGWSAVRVGALRMLGALAMARGLPEEATRCLADAERRAGADANELEVAACRLERADVKRDRGDLAGAEVDYTSALVEFEARRDVHCAARCVLGLGRTARLAGDRAGAVTQLARARALYSAAGGAVGVAHCALEEAHLARMRGDLAAAERGFELARSRLRARGAAEAILADMYAGALYCERGAFRAGRDLLEEALTEAARQSRRGWVAGVHVRMLPSAAAMRDWRAWDRHFERARTLLRQTRLVDDDHARMATLAASLCHRAGDRGRARGAYELAWRQWEALGRADRARPIEHVLNGFSDAEDDTTATEPMAAPDLGEVSRDA